MNSLHDNQKLINSANSRLRIEVTAVEARVGTTKEVLINGKAIKFAIPAGTNDGEILEISDNTDTCPMEDHRKRHNIVVSISDPIKKYNNVTLEDLGLSINGILVSKWLAGENTVVASKQALIELDIHGGKLTVESPCEMLLLRHVVKANERCDCNQPILQAIRINKENVNQSLQTNNKTMPHHVGKKTCKLEEKKELVSSQTINSHKAGVSHVHSQHLSPNGKTKIEIERVINYIKTSYAFQASEVLEKIISHEKQRIEDEQVLWRVGGAVIGAALGISDGFGIMDIGTSFAFSNIAALAHNQASKEQREFLKKVHALWLVDQRSPIDLRRRIGEPNGRYIGYAQDLENVDLASNIVAFNVHQNSSRGFSLQALGPASEQAAGFTDELSKKKMLEVFDAESFETLASQLYPVDRACIPLKLIRTISDEEAEEKDPMFRYLRVAGVPHRIVTGEGEGILYKMNIPSHSDF